MVWSALSYLALVNLAAMCTAVETILTGLTAESFARTADQGRLLDRLALRSLERPELIQGLTGPCSILSLIGLAWVLLLCFGDTFQAETPLTLLPCLGAALLAVFYAQILPRAYFQLHPERWARPAALALRLSRILLYPLVFFTTPLFLGATRPFGLLLGSVTKEDLRTLLAAEPGGGDVADVEREMINRILTYSHKKVEDVMLPLIEACALERKTTVGQAIALIKENGYSRYPVYDQRIDNIIGLIHTRDLFAVTDREAPVSMFLRPALYIPESQSAKDLLDVFRAGQSNLAVVVDEYGGAIGICSVEDILELVVGEIEDEYDDQVEDLYVRIAPNHYLINARMEISRINEVLELDLPEGDYDTLGGYLLELLRRIPGKGEKLSVGNLEFSIKEATRRAIEEVYLTVG